MSGHLLLSVFLVVANLIGGVLIFIPLMANDVEHPFPCLLAIRTSYFENCPFQILCPFLKLGYWSFNCLVVNSSS